MAIKVSGTTVISDSRNVENISSVTANTFVGNGSGLTNVLPAINQPINVTPVNGATGLGANYQLITLTGSNYLSLGGYNMAAAQFQVSAVSDFASTIINTGDVAGTSVSYSFNPSGTLTTSTTYYWRVRYKDANGSYSDWSVSTSFVTNSSYLLALGASYQGGYSIGKIGVISGNTSTIYGVLLAPKASGQSATNLQWKTTETGTSGAGSFIDGLTNTNNIANATYPAANYTAGLTISGYDDWYLPAYDELTLAWNSRASLPSGETNDASEYWSSTAYSTASAFFFNFSGGFGDYGIVTNTKKARAVRRFAVTSMPLGTFMEGGYFIGTINVGNVTYGLILAPKASGQSPTTLQWKTTANATSGTYSDNDGWTNTNNMNNASHPAAQYTRGLNINGYTDWYLPSRLELGVWLAGGGSYSLPAGESPGESPLGYYWSSTAYVLGDLDTSFVYYYTGTETRYFKTNSYLVRAMRRFVIS